MSAQPGWYPSEGTMRWFDGQQWTEHRQPMPATPPPATATSPFTTLPAAPVRPPAKKGMPTWGKVTLGVVGTFITIGIIGNALGGSSSPSSAAYLADPQASSAAPAPAAAKTTAAKAATKAPSTKAAAPISVSPTIGEGDFVVGEDMPAGRWRTTMTVSDGCYWAIYRANTNQSDIIDNGIVNGGRPTVTLKKGQEFHSNGCGSWVKS